MLHARVDYNERVQDAADIIPVDEPVFLLRGQDIHAPIILELYATMVENSKKPDDTIVASIREHAKAMKRWQLAFGSKYPDMPSGESEY